MSRQSISGQLEPFLARSRGQGAPVARFVEREIRAYLECGVLAHGFLRVHCAACDHDRLVAPKYSNLAITERLVYASITGFGQTGPDRSRTGYDLIIQAMSLLMSITGRHSAEPGSGPP